MKLIKNLRKQMLSITFFVIEFHVREVGTAILYFQKNESCAELC